MGEANQIVYGLARSAAVMDVRLVMKERLDQAVVSRGLAPSRARARDLIQRGFVSLDGAACVKPSTGVTPGHIVRLSIEAPTYVSRGAEKLLSALDAFAFDPARRIALDIGASTGGFTQVLLERGAARVYAVDVGHGQLRSAVSDDRRVVALEGTDARALDHQLIPGPISAIVADVSFISLVKALPAALALAAPKAWLIALIKPQFEAGPDHVGRGGIVRDAAVQQHVVAEIEAWVSARSGWTTQGVVPSPILGGSGNKEFLIGATYRG